MILNKESFINEEAVNEDAVDQLTFPQTKEKVPDDFHKGVLKAIDYAENKCNLYVGSGVEGAFWGKLGKYFSKNAREKINKDKTKALYQLIIPRNMVFGLNTNSFNPPKEFKELADNMYKAAGYKKGHVSIEGIAKGATYYYKESGKKFMYIGLPVYPGVYGMVTKQIQLNFYCCDYDNEKLKAVKESTDPDYAKKYFSFKEDENEALHDYMDRDDEQEDYYVDPVFNKAITEYMDLVDTKTRRSLMHLDEAGQNTVLTNLTSRLYDHIVEKCDDIDYGEIPATKGDITKLSKYDSMKDTISIMHDLLKEYKQDTSPVDELSVAFSNVESRKELFERAFRYNSEFPIAVYNNVVMGIITGITYMIATCIEFIKDPGATSYRMALDKVAYSKTKDNLIYSSLKSFNKSCANKEFDKAMEAILKSSVRNFSGAVIAGGIAIGLLGTILVLIPVLRELIFLFYYMRVKISDYFDIQADLLQMNMYNLENNNTIDGPEKEKIIAKQEKIVNRFRKISNTFAIEMKKAEAESTKEKRNDDEAKMLINDIKSNDSSSSSALF